MEQIESDTEQEIAKNPRSTLLVFIGINMGLIVFSCIASDYGFHSFQRLWHSIVYDGFVTGIPYILALIIVLIAYFSESWLLRFGGLKGLAALHACLALLSVLMYGDKIGGHPRSCMAALGFFIGTVIITSIEFVFLVGLVFFNRSAYKKALPSSTLRKQHPNFSFFIILFHS